MEEIALTLTTQKSPTMARVAKPARLNARLTDAQKALLERAAQLSGRSLTEFVVRSAEDAAARAIREQEILALSAQDTEVFVAALLGPSHPTPRLALAAERHRKKLTTAS